MSRNAVRDDSWRHAGQALIHTLETLDDRVLLCADEVPVFVLRLLNDTNGEQGIRRARDFLEWLRSVRQHHSHRVRWIVAGSIGLDALAKRYGLGDTINDLAHFPLGAFSLETAATFLKQLAVTCGFSLDEATTQAILERIDWPLPYYLQIVISELDTRHFTYGEKPSPKGVKAVFQALLSPTHA